MANFCSTKIKTFPIHHLFIILQQKLLVVKNLNFLVTISISYKFVESLHCTLYLTLKYNFVKSGFWLWIPLNYTDLKFVAKIRLFWSWKCKHIMLIELLKGYNLPCLTCFSLNHFCHDLSWSMIFTARCCSGNRHLPSNLFFVDLCYCAVSITVVVNLTKVIWLA